MPRYVSKALIAFLLLATQVPSAVGQTASGASTSSPPPGDYVDNGGPPHIEDNQQPLLAASSVEVTQSGALMVVRVRGVASTIGWQNPTLVPLVRGTPSDGTLDLVLVAEPPPEAMPATGFAGAEAVLLVQQNHPYRAVRVRSATNVVALRTLPGRAEAAVTMNDCRDCVGHAWKAGAGDGQSVDVGTLPKNLRILSPTDAFPDVRPDPNRLTLLVGEDGKVIEAMWQ